MGRNKQSVHK